MFRKLLGFAVFAVIAVFLLKLFFGLFGMLIGLLLTVAWFAFIGFLPAQAKARRELLAAFGPLPVALVLYEAPHRVADAIGELARSLDARRMLTIAREMTKAFETIARMPLADAAAWLEADANRSRGEFVLIVDAPLADASAQAISAE